MAKLWNKFRYSSMDEEIKKMGYMYTMEFYSEIRKNKIRHLLENRWNWRSSC
jgi:hypothetical protein